MAPSEEEIKAQLMAEAEAAIDKLLAGQKKQGSPNLTDIEDMALAFRQDLGEKATQVLAEAVHALFPGDEDSARRWELNRYWSVSVPFSPS